jgi:ABC-type Fe3+-siderophore transport system permease subunit
MQKKLMEGLGLSALMAEVDGAGYFDFEQSNAAQKARNDFGVYREGLAAEYLQVDGQASTAKLRLRDDFERLGAATNTGHFDEDEEALVECFAQQIEETIDRLAAKPVWQRTLILWNFRMPGILKGLLVVAGLTIAIMFINSVLGK